MDKTNPLYIAYKKWRTLSTTADDLPYSPESAALHARHEMAWPQQEQGMLRVTKLELHVDNSKRSSYVEVDRNAGMAPELWLKLGFDPARLRLEVRISFDDMCESIESMAKDQGFELTRTKVRNVEECWTEHEERKPSAWAAHVDIGGYNHRTYVWVDAHPRNVLSDNMLTRPKGMSKGVYAELRQRTLREMCEREAKMLSGIADERMQCYHIGLTLHWDDEQIAGASLGGVWLDSGDAAEIMKTINEQGMLSELAHEAREWAKGYVKRAEQDILDATRKLSMGPACAYNQEDK